MRRMRHVVSTRDPRGTNSAMFSRIDSAYRVPRRLSPSRNWSATATNDPNGV